MSSLRNRLTLLCQKPAISWFDLIIFGLFLLGGFIYLHNALHWGVGYVGDVEYGDAEFWWNGATHIAQGIFQDNPGKGFRPGYFILAGLTLPVLGQQFQYYYLYFLITFLMTAGLFYLALRHYLGKLASACVTGMLVFNPYTAEWLATSTTDGTGLLLNIAALSCLLIGVQKNFRLSWLIAFGILFSLATLTRPLVTPYIGLVFLALLLLPKIPFQKRLKMAVCVLIAVCLPTFLWMGIQKMTIDRWAVSSNDASAFYAASDPKIQVWNPTMYDHIEDLAAKHYNTTPNNINDQQLNHMFWLTTINNYINNSQYHLSRIAPHIFKIASFSPKMAAKGSAFWQILFLEMLAIGIAIQFLLQRRWLRTLIFAGLGIAIYTTPSIIPYMTLLGGVMGLLFKWKNRDNIQLGIFLLSAYWLTGVAALYFIGGTWGPPSFSALFDFNALGYRLGSQVFFAGDLLACYCLIGLSRFKFTPNTNHFFEPQKWRINRNTSLARGIVLGCFGVFLVATVSIYILGSTIVAKRIYARNHSSILLYPPLQPVVQFLKQHAGYPVITGQINKGGLINEPPYYKNGTTDLLLTGTVSAFIWNLPNQNRTQLMIHTQNQFRPYTMGPGFVILETPQHLEAKDWIGVQGAFVINQAPNNHNTSNLPYYITTPALRAFIPINPDGKSFALNKTVWFSFSKNAAQLETDGALQAKNAKITWVDNSGPAPFQRRFFLSPKKGKNSAELLLNVPAARGPSTLSFSYGMGDAPEGRQQPLAQTSSIGYYDFQISTGTKGSKKSQLVLIGRETIPPAGTDALPRKIELPILKNTQVVKVSFNHLLPNTGIWIYEFNLNAVDFVHSATKKST
jgi:hypothetical protein